LLDSTIKPVLLNTSDIRGGAARAAYRLHKGLQKIGIDSQMLVQRKESHDPTVVSPSGNISKALSLARPQLGKIHARIFGESGDGMFSPALVPGRMRHKIEALRADIVHLHWVADEFLSIREIGRINAPVVWTLHDCWAFTGGCHYPGDCQNYYRSCGRCPVLRSTTEFDLSRFVWKKKRRAWKTFQPTLVAPSHWIAECAGRSSLFNQARIEVIPNGVDLSRFKPIDRGVARELLGLPLDRFLILFGAIKSMSDRRKGADFLLGALQRLDKRRFKSPVELIIFGADPSEVGDYGGLRTHCFGYINDDIALALLYGAADLVVVPSLEDNLPNVAVEALACGRPVVAFRTGGLRELIDHRITGYLAERFSVDDLSAGIAECLNGTKPWEELSNNARRKAKRNYGIESVAAQYIQLYRSVLSAWHKPGDK